MKDSIIRTVTEYYPDTLAVYLFGSQADQTMREDSDVDIALLLPIATAKSAAELSQSDLRFSLEKRLKKSVDLINLQLASTVFQHEICCSGIRLYSGNLYETETFEMMTLSYYCKLNEERRDIMDSIISSRRIHDI
ncbi:MAG: nucleotidyltransferase domain-containing protein [Spirochaetales bacterium]|nr:nucleotidyltransferase domain-containing protein [Spirochaetales bacterium]